MTGTEVDEDDLERRWLEIKSADDLGDIVLEGAGIEDLAELHEDEDEADVETEELPDPDAPAEVEPEPKTMWPCAACGRLFDAESGDGGEWYFEEIDGHNHYKWCSASCYLESHPAVEEAEVADATSDSESSTGPEIERAVPSHDHDYPIGPLTKPFEAALDPIDQEFVANGGELTEDEGAVTIVSRPEPTTTTQPPAGGLGLF